MSRLAMTLLLLSLAATSAAQTIRGTVTYRERVALPSGTELEAVLEDVSRADAPAEVIARSRVTVPSTPPIAFTLTYDTAKIVATHQYVVRATLIVDDRPLFITDTSVPVITHGSPTTVAMKLRKAASTPDSPQTAKPLEGTYWKAVELGGQPLPAQKPPREPYLLFKGQRVSGSDGCNRVIGSYQMTGDAVTFGEMAGTRMACVDIGNRDTQFRHALKEARRVARADDRLEFVDGTGKRLAVFEAATPPARPSPPPAPTLTGTSWRLVMFQGGDGTTLTPADRSKYTIDFASGGRVTVQIDCNRGSSTWKSPGPNQLQFGALAMTKAQCPAGSMHDQMVKQWPYIRSYVIKNGHLFVSLMADGGIYEFEPVTKAPTPQRQ